MTGEMRLGQQTQARDSAGVRELMPMWFTHDPKLQVADDLLKKLLQRGQIPQRLRRAAVCLDNPFDSVHPCTPRLRLGLTAIRTKLADLWNGLPAVQTELRLRSSHSTAGSRGSTRRC